MKLALAAALAALFVGSASAYETTGMSYDHLDITYSCGSPELQQAVQEWAAVSALRDGGCSDTPDIVATVVSPWPYPQSILGLAALTATNFPGHSVLQCSIQIAPIVQHFLGVYVHEVGHCLWSSHSLIPDAAMAPWCCNPLNEDDIAGIVSAYGPEPIIYRSFMPMVGR